MAEWLTVREIFSSSSGDWLLEDSVAMPLNRDDIVEPCLS